VPTPTVQLEVERQRAAGGIALTASHNPVEGNALKFVGPDGRFLSPERAGEFLASVDQGIPAVRWDELGSTRSIPDAVQHHVDRITMLDEVDPESVRGARLRVVLDAVHGAGGEIARELLDRMGTDFTVLFEEPTGLFPRPPEPLAENLSLLAEEVKRQGADVGLAFDPDVDRLSLVDETGRAVGEESTLPLAADHVLSVSPGPVVTNLSTSARIEAVAARYDQPVVRTPVGEANVVQGILDAGARIGGEGNGGVILPALHMGRDAPAGLALVLSGLARRGEPLSRWVDSLPGLCMIKSRLPLGARLDWDRVAAALAELIPGAEPDRRDGLRMAGESEWVHLRESGTEPIIRVIAEAATEERARALLQTARAAIGE